MFFALFHVLLLTWLPYSVVLLMSMKKDQNYSGDRTFYILLKVFQGLFCLGTAAVPYSLLVSNTVLSSYIKQRYCSLIRLLRKSLFFQGTEEENTGIEFQRDIENAPALTQSI